MDQNSGLIVLGTAIGSAKLVEKLLGPTADYVGGGIKNWTEKRVNNVKRIFSKAADRLGPKLDEPGSVPPRVLKGILDDGSFCDDELSAEYFGGVLASSRSTIQRDDRGLTFLNVVSNLSAYQVRSHYVFYTLFKKHFNGEKFRTVYPVGNGPYHKIYIPFDVYAAAMDLQGLCCRNRLRAIILLRFFYHPPGIIFLKQHKSPFKWRHFEPTIILLCVRWYCRYQLSYRDLEEMMRERGLSVDHTTVFRWVQRYAPEINKRIRSHLKMSGTSYRLDETYVKVGTEWKYLYRAVDSTGQTIEFMLSAKRDISAAKRFFKKLMRAEHRRLPFSISVDKNAAYPEAFTTSQDERIVPKDCKLRRVKYLNNVIEQDHRFVKKKVRASQCFKSFHTAERTLEGIEAVNMMRKGQVKRLSGNDAQGQAKFVASLFQIAA